MSRLVFAVFDDVAALHRGAQAARAGNVELRECYSPFPVEGIDELLHQPQSRVRPAMAVGGIAIAALAYGLEWYSAVIDYPINSGGRPLNSWPAFMMFPFSVGILAAAICGAVAVLYQAGLTQLHHPLFEIRGFERASQDRFLLALRAPDDDEDFRQLNDDLHAAGALSIEEVNA